MNMTPEQAKKVQNLIHGLTFNKDGELIDNWWNQFIIKMICVTEPDLAVEQDMLCNLIRLEWLTRCFKGQNQKLQK